MEEIDWDELQILAASLGLTPEQFWGRRDDIDTGMTLREFDLFVRGSSIKFEREQEMLAWHAANLMSMWAKKGTKITPAKLMGKDTGNVDPKSLQAQLNEESNKSRKENLAPEIGKSKPYNPHERKQEMDDWVSGLVRMAENSSEDDTLDDA